MSSYSDVLCAVSKGPDGWKLRKKEMVDGVEPDVLETKRVC
jgi:hypothetical protein